MSKQFLSRIVHKLPPGTLRRLGALQFSNPLAKRVIRWGSQLLRNQDTTITYGIGAGLKFNAGNANPGYALGTSEPRIQEILKSCLKSGDIVYDIGANVGFFTILSANIVEARGHVYAFEPVPQNADSIRHNAQLNNFGHVTVCEKAVSSSSGEGELLLAAEPTWAKLSSTGTRPDVQGAITVGLVSIDEMVAKQTVLPPSVVKIDVEGAEIEVLKGMTQTVAKHGPIILCEMHGTNVPLAAVLEQFGYWTLVIEEPEKSITAARWDCHVLAGPSSKRNILQTVTK